MFDGPLEDRLSIRERIDSYSDAVFRRDAEAWIANWSDEAVWRISGSELRGRSQIKSAWIAAMDAFAVVGFFATPGAIRVEGGRAIARVYAQEILVDHNGKVLKIIGVYDDQLVKSAASWLFAERVYTVLHDAVTS